MTKLYAAIALILTIGFLSERANAGDLAPPPGPITATDRVTLSNADPLPIVLNAAGSFVLTSNLVTLGGSAIEIQSGGVTLDLNGFSIIGAGNGTDGITIAGGLTGVTIRNGVIHACQRGIVSTSGPTDSLLIEGVTVRECTGTAFEVFSATLRHCTAAFNLGTGFLVKGDSSLTECRAEDNGQEGIHCTGGVIEQCVAIGNAFSGIFATNGAVVRGCVARGNNNGISARDGTLVIGCVAYGNQFSGFEGGEATIIESCQARGNGLAGIGSGFVLSLGSRAVECIASTNASSGFEVDFQCVVDRCEAHDNNGAGVQVHFNDNRITANHLFGNSPNLNATGALANGNLIMQNTADGGYSINPGNSAAPVSMIGVAGPLDNITY